MSERRRWPQGAGAAPADHLLSDALLAFALGNFCALLQFSYFFLLEAFLSSRSTSFFVALFFWLIGLLIGLNLTSRRLFPVLLLAGTSAYYLASLIIHLYPFETSLLPALAASVVVSGLVPGYFFPFVSHRFQKIKHLLFHENNGFLLGSLLSLVGALYAGKWFLSLGPFAGMVPVIAIDLFQRRPRTARSAEVLQGTRASAAAGRDRLLGGAFALSAIGLHFGILQIALFFAIECYVTATYVGYFMVVLAWMGGVVLNLKTGRPKSLRLTLVLSAGAYYVFLAMTFLLGPHRLLWPVVALLIVVVGFPAGAFFRELARRVAGGALFFHENNGFTVGYVLSLVAFVKWGVHFLYWAPLLSFAFSFLAQRGDAAAALMMLPIAAFLCAAMGNLPAAWLLGIAAVFGFVLHFVRPPSPRPAEVTLAEPLAKPVNWARLAGWETRTVLFISGFNLLLLQYFITREFASILAASELTVLIVGASYFVGFSIGYGVSRRVPLWMAQAAAVATFFLHLLILAFVRFGAGYLISAGYGLEVMIALLVLTSFCTSAFYAIFLPRLIETYGPQSLTSSYTWELTGAGAGVLAMLFLTVLAPAFLWPLYLVLLLALTYVLTRENPWALSFLIIGLFAIALFARHQEKVAVYSAEDYYQTRGYAHPKLLFAGNSLYQTVEVVAGYRDRERTLPYVRSAFLNGVEYFRYRYDSAGDPDSEPALSEFTYFLSEVPAKYLYRAKGKKLRTLILGAGSMYSLYRVQEYSGRTTMVEIDPLVVESAKSRWFDVNRIDVVNNFEIVIDDAKHYLLSTEEQFDLIIMDISAPYYLQTNLLHGKDFFQLVRSRLQPDGIFAESTQSRPDHHHPNSMPMRILRAAIDVFPRYRVIDCRGAQRGRRGFVYASTSFTFATQDLVRIMQEDGKYAGTSIYSEGSSHFRFEKTVPFSLTNMETLLSSNQGRLRRRLAPGRQADGTHANETKFRLPAALKRNLADRTFCWTAASVMLAAVAARLLHKRPN